MKDTSRNSHPLSDEIQKIGEKMFGDISFAESLMEDEEIQKLFGGKKPESYMPTHPLPQTVEKEISLEIINLLEHMASDPTKSRKHSRHFHALSNRFREAVSKKVLLPYHISVFDDDFSRIFPESYCFFETTNYNSYVPTPYLVSLAGNPATIEPNYVFSENRILRIQFLALIQTQAGFTPAHLAAFLKIQAPRHTHYFHLPYLSKATVKKLAGFLQLDKCFDSFYTFLLRSVDFAWGIVPSYVSRKIQLTYLHPATLNTWADDTDRRIGLRPAFPLANLVHAGLLESYTRSLPFYQSDLSQYFHPYPVVPQFLIPYTQPPHQSDPQDLGALSTRYSTIRFIFTELAYQLLLEEKLFSRRSAATSPDVLEKTIFFVSTPLTLPEVQSPSLQCHSIQSQKDLTQVLRSFKKAEKQRTPTLPVLILNFLDGFAPELTVKQLYPFLLHSKVLILCGNVPPAELPQLPLHGEDLSALLADPDVGICVSKLSCLLFYSINQLLSYRALRLNRWMIFASMCGFCGTPNTNFYLNKGYPIIEYPGKLREAWLNNHPDMIPAYCRYINQNMNRYRKASKRLDTLLKPFQTCCGAQFSSKSLPAKVRPWKERLYTALLLDYILNHPLSRPLTAPVAGNVFKTWLYAIVPPKQRPAQKCSLRLFSSFVDFVRHASMAVSKDAYFQAQTRGDFSALGWQDDTTLYLDYDRFWSDFIRYANLPDTHREMRNRFLREMFRPGCPGEHFAYQTDVKSGHWGHPIRENKRAKPLGRFLRLKTDILAEESSQ